MSDPVGPVKSLVTPTYLEYSYTATGAHAQFLKALSEGRLIGQRCP